MPNLKSAASNENRITKASKRGLLLAAIICISFSLRAPITAIGSLAGLIHEDLGVSNGFIGLITTLPLMAFAVCSPFVSRISERFGMGNTMLAGLIAIVAGGVLRSYTGIPGLLAGTALIGMGISTANVLIPSIVKLEFPERIGIVTGIYITSMAIFASLGAGVSYPIAKSGLGWKASLTVWAVIALAAIFAWIPQRNLGLKGNGCQTLEHREKSIWKSHLAWYITLFMGLQSLNFYSLTAWIPSILQSYGMEPVIAGYMALWFQLIGIPSSFMIPILADKVKNQKTIVIASCIAYFLGLGMLLFFHSTPVVIVALLFLSNGGSAGFSWSMVMISLKSNDAEEAAKLSGMSQSVGYLLAAIGPTLCGFLYDLTGKWTIVLGLFIGITVMMVITGILAAKKDKLFN